MVNITAITVRKLFAHQNSKIESHSVKPFSKAEDLSVSAIQGTNIDGDGANIAKSGEKGQWIPTQLA